MVEADAGRLAERLRPHWAAGRELLLIMSVEQALRAVAPLLVASPDATPAVVCLDAAGRLALPLLAGTPPGADTLARRVAALTGGRALVGAAPETDTTPQRNTPATTYPITLNRLRDAPVLVVGGGPVGERKVRGLLAVAAAVRLISPEATAQLRAWSEAGRLHWEQRGYAPGDLAGARLVFAATGDRATNAQVARDAAAAGLLCNQADDPEGSDFHLPAVHRTNGLTIAVSTSGASPARAAHIRDRIAGLLEHEA
ncbi:MAG: hypothetical protein OHK0022_40810 [Roseiflexaceae bacterium]